MLYREDYYKTEKKDEEESPDQIHVNTAELLVQKNRHGPTGVVKLAWNPEYTMYTCIDHTHEGEG